MPSAGLLRLPGFDIGAVLEVRAGVTIYIGQAYCKGGHHAAGVNFLGGKYATVFADFSYDPHILDFLPFAEIDAPRVPLRFVLFTNSDVDFACVAIDCEGLPVPFDRRKDRIRVRSKPAQRGCD
jgi:hypothetical protein